MRVGIGYDAHVLTGGRALVLGGVQIPYEKGLHGYSDADVLVHAIMDALLGAAGLKDIGHQFPTGDPQYENASSIHLLEQTGFLIGANGFIIKNIDSILIAQAPKIAPYIDEMRHNIAAVLSIKDDQVMVKATTTDGLGFTGKGEGMAAQAVVLLEE
ncbi:MAG: 2-C-methyl-D-erythritol 2,4-cyclodiphosphate synthase [Dehalococcoidia bacterium]|nr:MAG: 2-C-methyl-D-erythritol 2,4-cyclodiphosphate synthase [Dehalococcoidia bacterium]